MAVGMGWFMSWLGAQFAALPYPTKSYSGQTVVVTGANVGLGLEAARHFVRLDAQKVIVAVRSRSKGEAAAKSIHESTGRVGVVEVWELDLSSHASVKAFAERASTLERLDIVINNAGILTRDFELVEGNESTITVNVVSALLLSLLLLPKLRDTSVRFKKEVVLTFTGSFTHFMTDFPEQKKENILKDLAIQANADMANRYYVSKLMQLLVVQELAAQITESSKPGDITVSVVNPGFVKTSIMRNAGTVFKIFFPPWRALIARSTEKGSRTLLHGAAGGKETHGQYLDACAVATSYIEQGIWAPAENFLIVVKDDCETYKHLQNPEEFLVDIYSGYGSIESERNKLKEARDAFTAQHSWFQKAVANGQIHKPDVREALALGGLAQGYAGLGELQEAEGFYQKCIDAWKACPDSGSPTIYEFHYGTCLAFSGKLQDAQAHLEEVIRVGNVDANTYRAGLLRYALGNVHQLLGEFQTALVEHKLCLQNFQASLGESHHSTADAYFKVGRDYAQIQEYANADANYEKALQIYGGNAEYLQEIARTMYCRGLNFEKLLKNPEAELWLDKALTLMRQVAGQTWIPVQGKKSHDEMVNF